MHPQMSTTVFYLKMTSGDHHTTSLSVILTIDELEGKKKPQKKGGHIKVTPARHPLCSDERKKITFMDAASLQKV